jgi:cell division inhibitor SulA
MPVYLSAQKVWPKIVRSYDEVKAIRAAKSKGYDAIRVRDDQNGVVNWVVFDPTQVKSAIGNRGTFDPTNPDIRFSRTTAQSIASSMGDMTPDQEKAYKNVAGVKAVPTVRERMDALKANLGLKLRQGLVDQFAAIKQLDQNAYVQARMSKGTDGTLEAMLMYGKPFMRDGAPDVGIKDGGFAKVLASLKGEQDRWMMWIAAQRAEKLKAEGKENLMTDDDISALKTLNAGRMADGTARTPVYAKALAELNEYNDAMLKLAMDSGLIDQDAYDLMAGQPYVPFYRLMEDGDMKGPKFSSGLTNQKAWQKLKGGTQQLNADLLQNMLLNWSHLLQASAKNRAATATMDAAEKMAVAYKVSADTKGAVKVMRDGSAEHWMVEDPYLLDAISAIHYVPSPLMKPLAKFKQLLTWGVTVNPTFKIRNLIRDSVSAIAQSELGYNPGANAAKGWKLTAKDSQIYASMLASGGLIKFGTQENTDRLRAQVAKLGGVMLDKGGSERFFGQIKDLYDVYNEFGDRAENVNRAALYDALIKKGKTHAEAAFMARDLMDFSMGGSAPVVRFLTQTVPFLNARLVGLDKLGRAAMEDPRRFAAVTGAVALASLALMAGYSDDEDWKKREDWDRDAYWWFKIGGQAYRIPKPFEVGAIGTLAERTAELMFNDEMTGKRYMERVSHMLSGTFSFNPVPQAFKPLLDLYANKDSFTGRAIESQADQRLRPQDRYSERTPEVAKFLGGLGLPDPAQLVKGEYSALSPKQVEHLIRGYFSWVGTAAMTVSDFGLRPLAGRGERPDMRLKYVFIAGNFVENLPAGSSRYDA